MEYFCNFIWERGLREKNEDSLCIRQITQNGTSYLLAIVCDGIGGLAEGENASSYVVNSMLETVKKLIKRRKNISADKIHNLFLQKIYQCHGTLVRYGKERQIRLGTTISMVFIAERHGYLFNVGDSAVFYGKRKLKRRSTIRHSNTGALLQAVGTGKTPKAEYKRFRVRKGMVILLASDGFYKRCEAEIKNEDWIKLLPCDEKGIGEELKRIKDRVQGLGERDNISAICIKCSGK